jgi:O-acetyl-ADP-ribose deacetylase (regulator of RNase III)
MACAAGEVEPGRMLVVKNRELTGNPRYIINFPTKRHWKGKSKLEDIDAGLRALVNEVRERNIASIAIPPLGCGHGGLNWSDIFPRIERAFAALPEVHVLVYEPKGSPSPRKVVDRTKRPNMTPGRAAVLCLMNRYLVPGYLYQLTMLEVQKLTYFMQCSGEELQLNFVKHFYGPYADNLRKVLEKIDGHFIEGYGAGDGTNSPATPLTLREDAAEEAEEFLRHQSDVQQRFHRVAALIEGFETPYGMELLSSVHWVATRENSAAAQDSSVAVQEVHGWNDRKRRPMQSKHIEAAWQRLRDERWL